MAVALLIVLSMVTFSIFTWCHASVAPRRNARSALRGAGCYCGNRPSDCGEAGLLEPVPVQYWHWLRGIFVASYDYGSGVEHCPAPVLIFLYHEAARVA
jgi:peptide/nickel transport system permease protein